MKIFTILDNVEFGQLALPEFQRGYVWSRDQVRGLLVSLYRRYPVGGLLVWTTEVDPAVVRGTTVGGVVKLLLDGQQRVTSLYGVVKGQAPQFFQGNAKAFADLYFNVRTEVFEFYGPVKMKDDPFWVSVTSVFQTPLEELLERLADHVTDVKESILYQTRLGRIRGIGDIELHVEEITGKDRTIDEVVDIFNRVNSGGTKLSAGDLALARICADWPDARAEIARLRSKWEAAGFSFKQELILRCATAIATDSAAFSSLKSVSVEDVASALKKAEQAIDFLLNLLADRLGIDHDRVLAGRGALAAAARHVELNGGHIVDHHEQQRLLFWYVHTFLWGRYSSSTETTLQRDLEALSRNGIKGLITELDRWRGSLVIRAEDFDSSSVGARFYPMLYVMSRVDGARDLGNGMQLSAGLLGAGSQLHLHHIFPKAKLYDAGFERADVNALANFCFLTAQSNLAIGSGDPAEYLDRVKTSQPGALESQWIPTDPALWHIDRYQDFLRSRRELLAAAANRLLDSLAAGAAPDDARPRTPLVPAIGAEPAARRITAPEQDIEPVLLEIVELAARLGIAAPELDHEVSDHESGELLAIADLAWPEGIQPGRTEPVALLLEPDKDMEARLGALGYRFFVDQQGLIWHLEEVLALDVDGDDIVGARE